jgi:hypothetical protein
MVTVMRGLVYYSVAMVEMVPDGDWMIAFTVILNPSTSSIGSYKALVECAVERLIRM